MIPARTLAIALSSGLLSSAMVMAQMERLSLPNFPGMTASIDSCAAALPVSIVALRTSDLVDGTALRKVMAWAQLMAQTECPQASVIQLVARVDGKPVYKGTAHKADGWVLVEVKPTAQEKTSLATPEKVKALAKSGSGTTVDVAPPASKPASSSEPIEPQQSPPLRHQPSRPQRRMIQNT